MSIKKILFPFAMLCCATFVLNGCVRTEFRSMGTYPTPVVHQPRLQPESDKSEVAVSLDGMGIIKGDWLSSEDVTAGGASLQGTYRFSGIFSNFYVSGNVDGYAGEMNFGCIDRSSCGLKYKEWLKTQKGKDDYFFWSLQEHVQLGFDFSFKFGLMLGLGVGARFYQGGGDYDDTRKDLEKVYTNINNKDDGFGVSPMYSARLGYYIGRNGQWGSVVLESNWFNETINDDDAFKIPMMLSYFHPSGFHGGVALSLEELTFTLGKTFTF